jgi:hypothetical protein
MEREVGMREEREGRERVSCLSFSLYFLDSFFKKTSCELFIQITNRFYFWDPRVEIFKARCHVNKFRETFVLYLPIYYIWTWDYLMFLYLPIYFLFLYLPIYNNYTYYFYTYRYTCYFYTFRSTITILAIYVLADLLVVSICIDLLQLYLGYTSILN